MTDWSGYLGLILQGAVVTVQLTVMGSALASLFGAPRAQLAPGAGRLSPLRFE